MPLELISTALLLGLASSGHCIFMCGGISCALSQTESKALSAQHQLRLVLFHIGRISCYASLGVLFALFIALLNPQSALFDNTLRTIAACLIIAMGLYIAGINRYLKSIETQMAFIWKALQPFSTKLMQDHSISSRLMLGYIWGFLPCGMIYSTVLWASTAANADETHAVLTSALLMFCFGLGTVPSLLLLNITSLKIGDYISRFFRAAKGKKYTGILLAVFGLWSLISIYLPMPHALHSMPENDSQQHLQPPHQSHHGMQEHHHHQHH